MITEKEWDDRYLPVFDGDELVEFEATDVDLPGAIEFAKKLADHPSNWEKHIWTTSDDGENWSMRNGVWRMDRMKYNFSIIPWEGESGCIVVYDDFAGTDGDFRDGRVND